MMSSAIRPTPEARPPVVPGALPGRGRPRLFGRTLLIGASVGLALALSGCAAVVGGGAALGVAAYQERGVEGVSRDVKISALLSEAFVKYDHELLLKVGTTVYEGRVMLTGQVKDPKVQADAVRLAWTVPGVADVLNEIQVVPGGSVIDSARDAWITAQLKSKLTFDEEVYAINYTMETVGGTVYVMGIAQNRTELARVIGHARSIDHVQRIVEHVRVKDGS
jgi:osmotically-inducible protein OsmY